MALVRRDLRDSGVSRVYRDPDVELFLETSLVCHAEESGVSDLKLHRFQCNILQL